MLDKKIRQLLKPFRIRFLFQVMIRNLAYALVGFSTILLILILISKLTPIPFIWNKIIAIGLFFIFISLMWSLIKKPTYYDAGKLVDTMGLKERVVTSLELTGDNSTLATIQKQDTINKLGNRELVKNISIKPPIKILTISIILIIVSLIVGFIRTPSNEIALRQEKNKEIIEKEVENIEKVKKQITEDKSLSAEEKKLIEKRLEELKKQLENNNQQELQKEILKTQKDVEKLKQELIDKEIKKISEKLANKEFTKELAKKLETKDSNEIKTEIEKMTNKLMNSDEEELNKIAEEMKTLAQELQENPNLANAFNEVSNSISQSIDQNINNTNLIDNMSNLQKNLNNELSNSETSQVLAEVTNTLTQLNETVNQSLQQSDSNGNNQGNGQSQDNNAGGNENNGDSNGQGSGQGSGNGQSQGTDEGTGNGNSSSGEKSNNDGSEKQVKEYEKLFTPKNLGGEGEPSQVHSNINESGNKDITQIKKFGDVAGESVPYGEVLDSYKLNAYKRLDSDEIPESMKELIKEYFSELD